MSGHKIDLADDDLIPYESDCNWCGNKVFDESGFCKSCTALIKAEQDEANKAKSLMIALGIPIHNHGWHAQPTLGVEYETVGIEAVELYKIFTNKEKLKELIFKLTNKAFL